MSGAAPKGRLHTFFVVKEAGKPDHIVVWDTQDLSVGRSDENDFHADHGEISRRHCVFQKLTSSCVVKNLSTSNPTLVNNQSVDTHSLKTKDVVRVAEIEFVFYQVTKNPVTLGAKVEYASQLKSFGPAGGAASSPEATMLGLMDPVADAGDDDDFEVRPAGEFEYDLHGIDDMPQGPEPRNLDLELEPPGVADLDMPPEREPWTLDEDAAPRRAAPAAAAAAAPAKPAARGALTLHLEVEGLQGDLRRVVESLLGKTLELPSLRIRVKADDLG